MQVFYEAGFKDVASEKTDKSTYVYGSRTGSLDHVLALDSAGGAENAANTQNTSTEAALPSSGFDAITGADIWNINSVEALALEYSRFNYNAADLFAPDQFRASDHDPVIVGLFDEDSDDGGSDGASSDSDGADGGSEEADGSDSAGSDGAGSSADGADAGSDSASDSDSGNNGTASASSDASASDADSGSDAGGHLPRTGTDLTVMMAIAAGLIAIGAGVVFLVRRRRLS